MMNSPFKILSLSLLFLLLTATVPLKNVKAQDINPGDILRAGVNDANLLMEFYLRPFGPGLGAGLNSGWFTSPRPHRPLGFDFRISSTFASVPSSDQIINMQGLVFEHLRVLDGPVLSPTLFGEDTPGTRLGETFTNPETGQTEELYSFTMPSGIDFHYVITPMAQFSLGLLYETDITVRYLPPLGLSDEFDLNLWGLGVQHGLNQWLNQAPDALDISVHFGYTQITADFDFLVEPGEDMETQNPHPASTWETQDMEIKSSAFTSSLIIGKQFPVISLYGGLSFQQAMTSVRATGAYPVIVPLGPEEYTPGGANRRVEIIENPLDLEFESNFRMSYFVGGRLRLAIAAISASINFGEYRSVNVGVGISFR